MRRDEVLQKLKSHYSEIETMGVQSLYLFGSTARDEAAPASDIDLLVEFRDQITLKRYATLYYFLEDLLGHTIDLVTQEAIDERVRPYIEKDAIRIQ